MTRAAKAKSLDSRISTEGREFRYPVIMIQPVPVVLAALANLAATNQVPRHTGFLARAMGHLLVAPDEFVTSVLEQAILVSTARRSVEGLESVLLTGAEAAICVGQTEIALNAFRVLRAFPATSSEVFRPILFVDREHRLMTVLTVSECNQALRKLEKTSRNILFANGIGFPLRNANSSAEDTKLEQDIIRWTAHVFAAAGFTVGMIAAIKKSRRETPIAVKVKGNWKLPGIWKGLGAGGLYTPIPTLTSAGWLLGNIVGSHIAPGLVTGIRWGQKKIGLGGSGPKSGGGTSGGGVPPGTGPLKEPGGITPNDIGFDPKDVGPWEKQPPPEKSPGPGPGGPGPGTPATPNIVIGEEPFTVIGSDGDTTVTTTTTSGGTQTVHQSKDGTVTITDKDQNGQVTSQQTFPPVEPDSKPPPKDDDDSGTPAPDDDDPGGPAGFPAPDDPNPGGPAGFPDEDDDTPGGPAGFRIDEYPVPDGDSPGSPVSRGRTFLISSPFLGEARNLGNLEGF